MNEYSLFKTEAKIITEELQVTKKLPFLCGENLIKGF